MEILKFNQLESQGIQILSPSLLLIEQKKFRLGPVFAKHCTKAVLDFCRIVQADSFIVEHSHYFSIWLRYQTKQRSSESLPQKNQAIPADKTEPLAPLQPAVEIQTIDSAFIEACQVELVNLIGPIGKILVRQAVDTLNAPTALTFIESLTQSIPDSGKAQCFRSKFIPERSECNKKN